MAELGFRSIKSHTSLECNFNIFITLVGIIYWNRIIRIKIPTKNTFQIISETMRSDKLGSQLDRKSKTFFFTFFNVLFYFPECACFLNQRRQNSLVAVFTYKYQIFCRPEWTKVVTT